MRYLITGGSGYIGTRLVELLSRREDTEKIVIADVVPPKGGYRPKTEFERVDVRDRGAVHSALQRANPDVLVHLAFILNPVARRGLHVRRGRERHPQRARGGRRGGDRAGARHDLAPWRTARSRTTRTRSPRTTRCAAWRASPTRATRPSPTGSCQLWALQHPDVITTIVRPCIVFGPNVDNYLVRLWTKQPFTVDAGQPRRRDPVRARGRRGRRDQPAAARPPRGPVQPVARRADDAARVRRGARHPDPQDAVLALPRDRASCSGACASPRRRPARSTSRATRGSSRTRS